MSKRNKKSHRKAEAATTVLHRVAGIAITDLSNTEVTRAADPADEWSRDSTHISHNIRGFDVVDDNIYADLVLPYQPVAGTDYWLLYVIYTTGDSFGSDSGRIDYVDMYLSETEARENAERIRKHSEARNQADDERFSVSLVSSGGQMYKFHCPWIGYFEEIEGIHVQKMRLGSAG